MGSGRSEKGSERSEKCSGGSEICSGGSETYSGMDTELEGIVKDEVRVDWVALVDQSSSDLRSQ